MNSISNETLERLEVYKKISSDVINKIENNLTYVETLLIYEIMNSNFFNKDKMFFNYQLFSKLTIKKYSKLYEKELITLKKDLIESLNNDLKYATNEAVKENVVNMIKILEKPIEEKFEEKSKVMIENFRLSLAEIIETNGLLNSENTKETVSLIDSQIDSKSVIEEAKAQALAEKQKQEEMLKLKQQEEKRKQEELAKIKALEEMRRQQEELVQKREKEIREKQEEIKNKEKEIREKQEEILQENKEIESMLGAIDNIYDEMGDANLDQIDYTTFLKYIEEEEVDSLNLDTLIKEEENIELNENLSKTLDDLDLGNSSALEVKTEESSTLDEELESLNLNDDISSLNLDEELASLNLDDDIASLNLDDDIASLNLDDELASLSLDDEMEAALTDLNTSDDILDVEVISEEMTSEELEKEVMKSLDLEELESELSGEIDGDMLDGMDSIEDIDQLLDNLEEDTNDSKNSEKKGKFGRIKFGFKKNK